MKFDINRNPLRIHSAQKCVERLNMLSHTFDGGIPARESLQTVPNRFEGSSSTISTKNKEDAYPPKK